MTVALRPDYRAGHSRGVDYTQCRFCKTRDSVAFYTTGFQGHCEECCPEHEFEYDREVHDHVCNKCGAPTPYDWHREDYD